jgi:hypothetical protein
LPRAGDIAHQLVIAARLAARGLRRRLSGPGAAPASNAEFRATLEPWVTALPAGLVAGHAFHWLPTTQPPWHDTGIDLEPGESVTLLADGRVYLSRALDIWVGPACRLWCRIGEHGRVFRGTRATHTFTAGAGGRLWLASCFPGEWLDTSGRLGEPAPEYARASGGVSVLVLRWHRGTDVPGLFRGFAREARVPGLVLAETARLDQPVPVPDQWEYLWRLGPGEIFRPSLAPDGRRAIECRSHGDVGILQREARCPLVPGTRLRWSWRVDQLPMDLAEDTLPSHDYLSIGVEFDDGQDITYYWSAALPEGTVYRCPLPIWRDIETHVVVRSGPGALGHWIDEERDLHADYARILGGPAREVVRVWLIANSLLQRGHGRCEYASIRLETNEGTLEVL